MKQDAGTSTRVHLTKGITATIWVGARARNPDSRTTRKVRAMRRLCGTIVVRGTRTCVAVKRLGDVLAPPTFVSWGPGL